jgi:hypothetical protein
MLITRFSAREAVRTNRQNDARPAVGNWINLLKHVALVYGLGMMHRDDVSPIQKKTAIIHDGPAVAWESHHPEAHHA